MPESLPFPPSLSNTVPGGIPLSSETWALLPREVQALLLSQNQRILALENALQALQHRLDQDSSNSSKPPSSDSPKAKAKGKRRSPQTPSGKKPGAQPGHPGAQRALLPPDQVSSSTDCFPDRCQACQTSLDGRPPAGAPVRRQVYELPEIRPLLLEYRLFPVRCVCGCLTTASPPPEAQTGLGVRATALVALLVGRFRLSRSQVAEIFTEQLHIPLSKGAVQNACLRVSRALAAVVDPLMKALLEAWSLHIDETGWKQGKARRWLWVFVASAFTVFVVHARRGRQVLAELGLDTWLGYLHSDRWTAYNRHPQHFRQLCWAHLLRDLQAILDAGGKGAQAAAAALGGALGMFHHWHALERGELSRSEFQALVAPFQESFRSFCEQGSKQEDDGKWGALGRELLKYWASVFRFVEVEGLSPTNNAAERAVRGGVIWRRLTQGSRSEGGSLFVGRILTVIESCRQQNREVMGVLESALRAAQSGLPPPSLLPPERCPQQQAA